MHIPVLLLAMFGSGSLGAADYSTPATYMIGGRQYLVVVCSGGKLGAPSGDQYVAFALPPDDGKDE